MTNGEYAEMLMEREDFFPCYIIDADRYSISHANMIRSVEAGGAGGRYLIRAPRTTIKHFICWLRTKCGRTMEDLNKNQRILSYWVRFYSEEFYNF